MRRGDYKPARQACQSVLQSLRAEMQPLFAGRDELITLLARSDPASADRLAELFVAYRKIMSG